MIFENFEFSGFKEWNDVGKLEVCGGFWRRRDELLGAVGTDDVEAHQIGSDGATGGAAGAVVEENFGHAGRDGRISWAASGNF